MQRSKLIAVAFYFGAIVIGAAVGIALDRTWVRGRLDRLTQSQGAMRDRFAVELNLTSQQKAAADSIFGNAHRVDSVLIAPVMAQFTPLKPQRDSLRRAANAGFRALLTPEQQKLFDERQARRSRPNDGRR